jgi:hypothetical protein
MKRHHQRMHFVDSIAADAELRNNENCLLQATVQYSTGSVSTVMYYQLLSMISTSSVEIYHFLLQYIAAGTIMTGL